MAGVQDIDGEPCGFGALQGLLDLLALMTVTSHVDNGNSRDLAVAVPVKTNGLEMPSEGSF
ncbi:MAG: hypothetical protein M3256_15845 [Actinomycetota bacterium]|nr:hypothetical protein [Actinomycetota bacterium]